LLRKKGIDLDHNRFLILQGEVEQIALMKPIGQNENDTGMLEFLEDIIGSSRFKEPIDILKSRTGEFDELRSEKLNRVKLVEKEKDELEKPKNEALEYLHAENKISHKKNIGYQHYIMTYEQKVEETKKKKTEFEADCKEILEKLTKITAKKEKREGQFKELASTFENITKDLESAEESFRKHEITDAKLREEMMALNTKRKKAIQLSKLEKDQYEKFLKVPESNKEKISECQELRDKFLAQEEEEQKKYDEALENLKVETAEYQDQKERFETQLISLRKDENEKESQYNVAKSEMDLLLSAEQKEQCKLEQLEQKYSNATGGIGEKKEKIDDHSKAIPLLNKKMAGALTDIEKFNGTYDELTKNVRSMRSNFEETRTNQAATKSRGKVHDALLKQKQSGGIKGIYGRLGDLGAIDKKYDVAISTAVGGKLDTLIVDNVDTAKQCIDYLKRNDIGRINVLAHDKSLRWKSQVTDNFKSPENAPRLIDLISVDNEEMKTAFYQYVQDTLVAENMEQAKRIAFGSKRYRVVTLNGEVIETSGAMAGGGREKMCGKMGTQIVQKDDTDLGALERKLHDEEAKLTKITEKRQEAEAYLVNAKRELASREKELKKLKLEVTTFDQEEANLKKQIKEQKKIVEESRPDKAKLKELEKKCDQLQKIYDGASEAAREIKENVSKLNKKIKDIHTSKVKSVQGKLDAVKGQLDKVKKELTRLEVGIKSAERDLKKSKDKCDSYDLEVNEAENKMREMKKERESLEEEGTKIIQKVKALKDGEEEASERLKACKESLTNLEGDETKYKSECIEIDQANEKFALALKENTKVIQHWKREIVKLKLEDIPGEEKEELKQFTKEELGEVDIKQWQFELNMLEENLSAKRPDLKAIEEFKRKEAVYLERVAELDEITQKRDRAKKRHDDLRKTRLNEFMEGFGIITGKLKEMYQVSSSNFINYYFS
jgi:structural maintenance of chromosome 4